MGWRYTVVVIIAFVVACQVHCMSVPNLIRFNAPTNNVFNVYGLVKELESYEAQFFQLNERMDLKPIYGDLLVRVSSYAEENKRSTTAVDKKVLAWLYAAILSKIISMQAQQEPTLITDVLNYFPIAIRNIENYNHNLIISYKDDYRHSMELKIEEARNYIRQSVIPKIDEHFHTLEGKLDHLLNEVQERKEQAKRDKEKWEKYLRQLGISMQLQLALNVLSTIGTVVGFMGPIGAAAGVGKLWPYTIK